MANELHGNVAFNAAAAVEINFGTAAGVAHDVLCVDYVVWANNDVHLQEDADATVASHVIPANTYVSHVVPCRTLSVLGAGGASGVLYWKATPMGGTLGVSDVEAQDWRGGVHC